MNGIWIILAILVLIALGRTTGAGGRRGGIIVKPQTNTKRPKVYPAPQGINPKKKKKTSG